MAKLQDLKLIDSRFTKGQVRNLKGSKSQAQDSRRTDKTQVSPMRHESQAQDSRRTEPLQEKTSSPSHTSSDSSDFKEKKERPKLSKKKQDQAAYDEWYEHAYAQGWVAGRQGAAVTLKIGQLAGCTRHWQDVSANIEEYLKPAEPLKPGRFIAALKKGFQR